MKLDWNLGSWFGAQLGSTAWILIASVLTAARDFRTGALVFAVFLVPNIAGTVMWRRRERLSCSIAIQVLLSLIGVCGLLTVYILDRTNHWLAIQSGGSVSAPWAYGIIILVVATLLVVMHARYGRGTSSSVRL